MILSPSKFGVAVGETVGSDVGVAVGVAEGGSAVACGVGEALQFTSKNAQARIISERNFMLTPGEGFRNVMDCTVMLGAKRKRFYHI